MTLMMSVDVDWSGETTADPAQLNSE